MNSQIILNIKFIIKINKRINITKTYKKNLIRLKIEKKNI